MTFIKEEQDTHWRHIKTDDEPESPFPTGLWSVVLIPKEPIVQPNPRKEKKANKGSLPSPAPLETCEDDIELEEPPRKVQKTSTPSLLQDLQCSPSTSEDSPILETKEKHKSEKHKSEKHNQLGKKKDDRKEKGTRKLKRSENDKETENETENVQKDKRNDKKMNSGKEKETEKGKRNEQETENVPKDKGNDKKKDSEKKERN